MFAVIYKGPHGPTVDSDYPKLDAYRQAAMIVRMGHGYSMTCHADGSYTVAGDGLESITFSPGVQQ
jgi:hypothetical protein